MVCITMTKPMARRSRWSFSPSRSEVWRIQGRRACYGPLWPAPYLKPKEIFSTPAFQPSPTSKQQGNCGASALAPPALHPALSALPPLRSSARPRSPKAPRRASAPHLHASAPQPLPASARAPPAATKPYLLLKSRSSAPPPHPKISARAHRRRILL